MSKKIRPKKLGRVKKTWVSYSEVCYTILQSKVVMRKTSSNKKFVTTNGCWMLYIQRLYCMKSKKKEKSTSNGLLNHLTYLVWRICTICRSSMDWNTGDQAKCGSHDYDINPHNKISLLHLWEFWKLHEKFDANSFQNWESTRVTYFKVATNPLWFFKAKSDRLSF